MAALFIAFMGRPSRTVLMIDSVLFAALVAAAGLSAYFWLTAAVFVFLGMASMIFAATINTTLQTDVPDELRTRILSIYFLFLAGSTPLGGYATGFFADTIGIRSTMVLEGALCLVGVIGALVYLRLRESSVQVVPLEETGLEVPAR
jgi:predicted MFS family arabinose efflux permease